MEFPENHNIVMKNNAWRNIIRDASAILHLADAFIQSDLQSIQAIHFFVSMCIPWESNPQRLRY